MVLVQRVIPLYMIYRRGRRERDECYGIKKKKGTREFSVLSHFRLDKQTYRKYSYNLFFFPHLAFLCLIVLPPKTFQSDPPGLPFAVSYIRRCGSVLGAKKPKTGTEQSGSQWRQNWHWLRHLEVYPSMYRSHRGLRSRPRTPVVPPHSL